MSNFAEDIEKAAGGDIEAVVIGTHGGDDWSHRDETDGYLEPGENRYIPPSKRGVVLSWAEARPLLDYSFDAGFGGTDCHAIYAWTASRVLFVHEYDGSTGVHWVPRSPTEETPHMDGRDVYD